MSKPTLDITNLKGDDLWDALGSDKTFKVRKQPKVAKPRLLDPLAPAAGQHWDWSDTNLVLLVTTCECRCGRIYEHPNPTIFLRRETPSGALHYTAIEGRVEDPEIRFADIVPIIEYRQEAVDACQFCFNLAHIMDVARMPAEKLPALAPLPIPAAAAAPDETDLDMLFDDDEPDYDSSDLDEAFANLEGDAI